MITNTFEKVPVALFVYNRPEETLKTLEKLERNVFSDETKLFIFSDHAKDKESEQLVAKVREILFSKKWGFLDVEIIIHEKNKGLALSIIDGVNHVFMKSKSDAIIVLEDDLETSEFFLKYMNRNIVEYSKNMNIFSISAYIPENLVKESTKESLNSIYLLSRPSSWGWATWKSRWESVNWSDEYYIERYNELKKSKILDEGGEDLIFLLNEQIKGRINSWAIKFSVASIIQEKKNIYPNKSLIINNGFNSNATHGYLGNKKKFFSQLPISEEIDSLTIRSAPESYSMNLKMNKVYRMGILNHLKVLSRKMKLTKLMKKIIK